MGTGFQPIHLYMQGKITMKTGYTFVLALLVLLVGQSLSAKTIYTWTDKDGHIHITDRQPPKGALIKDEFSYQPEFHEELPEIDQPQDQGKIDREKSEALKKAGVERRKAEEAKRLAEEAIENAQQIKKETDEFVKNVQYKSRRIKSLQVKIKNKVEASNRARKEAERLRQLAFEAEEKALAAEAEAESIGEQTAPPPP